MIFSIIYPKVYKCSQNILSNLYMQGKSPMLNKTYSRTHRARDCVFCKGTNVLLGKWFLFRNWSAGQELVVNGIWLAWETGMGCGDYLTMLRSVRICQHWGELPVVRVENVQRFLWRSEDMSASQAKAS